jgi:hypothetical protein
MAWGAGVDSPRGQPCLSVPTYGQIVQLHLNYVGATNGACRIEAASRASVVLARICHNLLHVR